MYAVNVTSTTSGKCSISLSVTTSPVSVGVKRLSSSVTYCRRWIVSMIEAYVDGRPMPSSSSVLTNDASL